MDHWLQAFCRDYVPACPGCRASLSDATDRCPRCRLELRLGTKILEPYLAAWGTAMGAFGIIAGCGLFLLMLIVRRPFIVARMWSSHDPKPIVILCAAAGGVLGAIVTAVLIARRRHFCRIRRAGQWAAAAAAISVLFLYAIALTWAIH
jgi:nitrate reductase gamma subunit